MTLRVAVMTILWEPVDRAFSHNTDRDLKCLTLPSGKLANCCYIPLLDLLLIQFSNHWLYISFNTVNIYCEICRFHRLTEWLSSISDLAKLKFTKLIALCWNCWPFLYIFSVLLVIKWFGWQVTKYFWPRYGLNTSTQICYSVVTEKHSLSWTHCIRFNILKP